MRDLPDRLARIMRVDPGAAAIHTITATHSWSWVLACTDQLVRALEELGVPDAGSVGMILRNRPEHVAALIASVSARRCVVSLSPLTSDSTLSAQVRATPCHIVLAASDDWARPGLLEAVRESGAAGFELPTGGTGGLRPRVPPPDRRRGDALVAPGVLATVFTSGTTGTPKRVPIATSDFEAAVSAASQHSGSSQDGSGEPQLGTAVTIVSMPLAHISGLWGVVSAAAAGRRIAVLERFEARQWAEMVRRYRPAVANLQPTPIRMVLDAGIPPEWLASLRAVLVGTAPLDPVVADEFTARYGIPTLTMYGATEFAGAVAAWTLSDYRQWWSAKRGSVGRAYPGVDLRVVDASGGDVLEADRSGLLEVRLHSRGGDDWLRTTDVGRIDGDGFLWIEGRADNAINRGGFKVLPSSIEAALRAHPEVSDAAAVAIADHRLGQVPVAAVVGKTGAHPDEGDLLLWCRDRLAAYEVPVRIAVLAELPLTPTMKVDRTQLRRFFEDSSDRSVDLRARSG
ncbi:MAG TPA: fatty acid--CoA ligase family protein [Candidatus Dormibacteraeota bacterium]|nr:fatty acid--CoA ligase family protein [Candidatus Dormibacteraeota bacterium]